MRVRSKTRQGHKRQGGPLQRLAQPDSDAKLYLAPAKSAVSVAASTTGEATSCNAVVVALMLRPLPMRSAMVLMLFAVGIAAMMSAGPQKAKGRSPWSQTWSAKTAMM
mmetsp:Transcript_20622/g.58483  ORF Transcript_20622/g.58483 Transcript_20622/m.58483 type:complete len:108 (+) Transcript_20622:98-421(+)